MDDDAQEGDMTSSCPDESLLYTGVRLYAEEGTCSDVIVRVHTYRGVRDLDPRWDLCNHSPTGFNWGYGGSGPAQLALAILADALQDDRQAMAHYQKFKHRIVANWNDRFEVCVHEVRHFVTDADNKYEPWMQPWVLETKRIARRMSWGSFRELAGWFELERAQRELMRGFDGEDSDTDEDA